jgi:signal transduction histidine kinase
MRRRLTLSTVAAAAVAVVLLGGLLAVFVRSLILELSFQRLEEQARAVAAVVDRSDVSGGQIGAALRRLADSTESEVALLLPGVGLWQTPDFAADELLTGAERRSLDGGRLRVLVSGIAGTRIVVDADAGPTLTQIKQWWLLIAVIGAGALLVAAAVGAQQARELAVPLEHLARDARRLGDGDFSARATRSGIPEQDMVAEALDSTAERLGVLVQRASSFSADASHQLRTPLTALRLNIESLQFAGDRDDLVEAALAEVERLDTTITELLSLTSPDAGGAVFDPTGLVEDRLDAWRVLAQSEGREVRFRPYPVPQVRARTAAVGQALQVLLDNALRHGEGTVTVTVEVVPAEDERSVRIVVSDEGPGFDERRLPPPSPADRGRRGRGLALARSLLAAEGGSLRVERVPRGARVCLLLPIATADTTAGHTG